MDNIVCCSIECAAAHLLNDVENNKYERYSIF